MLIFHAFIVIPSLDYFNLLYTKEGHWQAKLDQVDLISGFAQRYLCFFLILTHFTRSFDLSISNRGKSSYNPVASMTLMPL